MQHMTTGIDLCQLYDPWITCDAVFIVCESKTRAAEPSVLEDLTLDEVVRECVWRGNITFLYYRFSDVDHSASISSVKRSGFAAKTHKGRVCLLFETQVELIICVSEHLSFLKFWWSLWPKPHQRDPQEFLERRDVNWGRRETREAWAAMYISKAESKIGVLGLTIIIPIHFIIRGCLDWLLGCTSFWPEAAVVSLVSGRMLPGYW
jgi:hypothetical protein